MLYPLSYGRGWSCQKGMGRARVLFLIQVFMPGRQLGGEGTDLIRRGPFRIQLLHAFRANPMGKLGVGMVTDIRFNLLPRSAVVADLFAGTTNRQQSSQSFNMGEGISQLLDESLALRFQLLLFSDIQRNADTSCNSPVEIAQWLDIGTQRPLLDGRDVAARLTLERSEMCLERNSFRFHREILRHGRPNDPLRCEAQSAQNAALHEGNCEIGVCNPQEGR